MKPYTSSYAPPVYELAGETPDPLDGHGELEAPTPKELDMARAISELLIQDGVIYEPSTGVHYAKVTTHVEIPRGRRLIFSDLPDTRIECRPVWLRYTPEYNRSTRWDDPDDYDLSLQHGAFLTLFDAVRATALDLKAMGYAHMDNTCPYCWGCTETECTHCNNQGFIPFKNLS